MMPAATAAFAGSSLHTLLPDARRMYWHWRHCSEPTARISRAEIRKWFERDDVADRLVEKGLLAETSLGKYRVTKVLGARPSSLSLTWWSQNEVGQPALRSPVPMIGKHFCQSSCQSNVIGIKMTDRWL
jgi:hypothetical protein